MKLEGATIQNIKTAHGPNLKRRILTYFIYCLSLVALFSELAANSSFLSPPGDSEEDAFVSLSPPDVDSVEPSEGAGAGGGGGNADVLPTGRFKALATWNTTAAVVLGATIVHFPGV